MRHQSRLRTSIQFRMATTAAAAMLLALVPVGGASAYTLQTLHSFCTESNCGDGDTPATGLVKDQHGNLYGTASVGGKYNKGLVFELVPNAKKTKYKEHILKNFCAQAKCTDGAYPYADLILDMDGRLYGTTSQGGKYDGGAVFRLAHKAGVVTFAVIHSFCSKKTNCADGAFPDPGLAYAGQASGAPWDESSPLFGVAWGGGANNKGLAYELAPNGSNWTYQVIHSFNPENCSATPGPLLVDSSGNLVGVTYCGGTYGQGALYRLAANTWKETTLHNFCAEAKCADGAQGIGRLIMDSAGDLFGVTENGGSGAHCSATLGCGVAFERPPGGPYTVIYNFCTLNNCKDGYGPMAGLIMDTSGNLFGTTYLGGSGMGGTVFSLSPGTTWTESVLYDFCSQSNCSDGGSSIAPVLDKNGKFYGTTTAGGANGNGGTVFELTP
jgi:uncharacterized repeat protein (TIGR03803 family)